VFTRSGATWSQQGGKLTGTGEIGPGQFGWSVALSADGSTALIGGYVDHVLGAAWVFKRSGATWTQQGAKLTGAGESSGGFFGLGVALSADGSTALVGGPGDASDEGAAWAFAAPALSAPTELRFGSQTTGQAGPESWLEVSNPGQLPFTFSGVAAIGGTNAADFAIPAGDDLCQFRTLSPGQVCWIGAAFTAGANGARTATLTLSGNYNGLTTPPVSLSGIGVAANSGPTGPTGAAGAAGAPGAAGAAGATGAKGATGSTGPTGPTGPASAGPTGATGAAGPGGVRLLPNPVRAYDSRTAAGAFHPGDGDTGNPRVIQIIGAVAGVPANAIGIVGNIAVTQEAGTGFATVWTNGPWPGTANINFVAGVDLSNSFSSGLSSTGTISVAASNTTHVVIDITGYILP
jgi:hypothetical protein